MANGDGATNGGDLKVWRGYTLGSLISIVTSVLSAALAVGFFAWTVSTWLRDARAERQEEFATIERQLSEQADIPMRIAHLTETTNGLAAAVQQDVAQRREDHVDTAQQFHDIMQRLDSLSDRVGGRHGAELLPGEPAPR
jgi:hypothetical protein